MLQRLERSERIGRAAQDFPSAIGQCGDCVTKQLPRRIGKCGFGCAAHTNQSNAFIGNSQEKRPFTLARDPHQCAFGKWRDTFKTDNILVSGFLKKFDAPHRQVHSLADEVVQLVENGQAEQGLEMLENARSGVLSIMLRLFADFQQVIRDNRREIALVLNGPAGAYAVSVDSVAAVEKLSDADTEELAGKGLEVTEGFLTSVAKRAKGQELVLILAPDSILDSATHSGFYKHRQYRRA